jgi:hypothetical protein
MTDQRKLRELTNAVRITGTLKEMNLEIKPNKKDPTVKQIQGNIVILSVVDGKANEHRVELFAKDTSKLFKGYETVKNEYKAIDTVGVENATRLTVTGSVDGNDYYGQDGQLREVNRIRGLFVNRVDDAAVQDEAIAQIELVVKNLRPLTDKEGIETGEYAIDAFTVGYNQSVIVLKNLVVGEDLAEVITGNYQAGNTGKLTFNINNYAEIVEKPVSPDAGGFGIQVEIGDEVKNYTRNLKVVGGFPPYYDERAFEEEDIVLANRIRALKLQELANTAQTPPAQSGGFGQGFGKPAGSTAAPGSLDISDDDLPF